MLKPVYTEPDNCQDCYKCIRECPVKAIKVEGNKASIIEERCIYCGHCTQVCPTGAKKIRDGLTRARMVIERYPGKVYLSLAPSYISEFGAETSTALISSIKRLGFAGVSETALGAEIVSSATEDFFVDAKNGVYISSACPVVVEYIRKYAVGHLPGIVPIVSPMIAHAKLLKELYGDDIKIIFAGPCVGKKSESDECPELIDVAITFRDLREWLDSDGAVAEEPSPDLSEGAFIPFTSRRGALYPVEGGMLAGMKTGSTAVRSMSFSDLETVREVLESLDPAQMDYTLFLELLACRGGCINGPARLCQTSLALKRNSVMERGLDGDAVKDFDRIDISLKVVADPQNAAHHYPESDIKEALASIGKTVPEDELNCSSCGYDSCRDFAVAMLDGIAEDNMCASYMRKVAHDKATVLLHKIPAGVVLVNAEMKVVDMNRSFAAAMGSEVLEVYEVSPGMTSADIGRISPFESIFLAAITTGEEILERRVKYGDKAWILSIYNIQPHRLVFGLLQDLQEPTVRKDWMLDKTREVIRNHMATVQQVAGLLGENAAFTDATLRSIIEAYDNDNKES